MEKLSREDFLKMIKPVTKDIEISEWEKTISIRKLTAKIVLNLLEMLNDDKTKADYPFELVVQSVVDDNGKPLFKLEEVYDIEFGIVDRIVLEIMDFNKMNPEAVKQARENLKKTIASTSSDLQEN